MGVDAARQVIPVLHAQQKLAGSVSYVKDYLFSGLVSLNFFHLAGTGLPQARRDRGTGSAISMVMATENLVLLFTLRSITDSNPS